MNFTGTKHNDTLKGTAHNDTFDMSQGGNDVVKGLAGNDTFIFGGAFTAKDSIDGGSGNDTLELDGTYTGKHAVTFGATTMVNVETIKLAAGHDYKLTTNDATVANKAVLTVDGSKLGASDILTFNGSAETNGSFHLTGGKGDDVLTGGAKNDTFDLTHGGSDTATGGGGNDTFTFGASYNSDDKVDGGAGNDTLSLNGGGYGTIQTNSIFYLPVNGILNVETLSLNGAHDYYLATDDSMVAAGHTMTLDASKVSASHTFAVNAFNESDGHLIVKGHAGTDIFGGGEQSDTFTGAGGSDFYIYDTSIPSTGSNYDTITDMDFAKDLFQIQAGMALFQPTAIDSPATNGNVDVGSSFDMDLATACSSSYLNANHAVLFTPATGTASDRTYLIVDLNDTAGYQHGDLVIDVTGYTGGLSTANFESI